MVIRKRGAEVTLFDAYGRPIAPDRFPRGPRRTQYAAAKSSRLTGDWSPVNTDINQILAQSIGAVKARVRQLVRDFPPFARAVNVLVNFTGELRFQSRVKNPDGGINKRLRQQIEDAFSFWAEEADVSGRLHFVEMMRLARRQEVEAGEYLLVKVEDRSPGRFIPFALQMYEADWLTSSADTYFGGGMSGRKGGTGTEIYQGVEYDLTTGRRVAYYLADPNGYQTKVTRIPAEKVIHGFEMLRPGQLRGVSVFAPAVLLAHDLSDYMDAEIDAVKMAAKYLGFVKTPDIELFQRSRAAWNADSSQKIEEMENAIIEYLRPGEEIQLAKQERPADSFEPFTRFVLRLISISTGISYELLAGDYSGLNYSVLRGIRNDLIKEFTPHQERHARQFCRPILRAVMDAMVISGKLAFPGYWSNPAPFLRAQWMATGMPAVDPYKEGRADADAVSSLQKSPQEIAAARGRDYEEILDEIAEARAMQEERGLMVEQAAGSMKTNPAAIAEEGQESEPTEDDRAAGQPAARGKPHLSVL